MAAAIGPLRLSRQHSSGPARPLLLNSSRTEALPRRACAGGARHVACLPGRPAPSVLLLHALLEGSAPVVVVRCLPAALPVMSPRPRPAPPFLDLVEMDSVVGHRGEAGQRRPEASYSKQQPACLVCSARDGRRRLAACGSKGIRMGPEYAAPASPVQRCRTSTVSRLCQCAAILTTTGSI